MVRHIAVAIACFGFSACADAPQKLRKATYPPGFHYITKEEIRETMAALGYWIDELDQVMWREEGVQPSDQERVLGILTEMSRLAGELKTGTRSNHPLLDRYAPWLQRDIKRALQGARSDPPNYYYAGAVAGACEYCHIPRHGAPGAAGPLRQP